MAFHCTVADCRHFTDGNGGFISYQVRRASIDKDQERFQNALERTQVQVQEGIETYIDMLRAGKGLFAADGAVSQSRFHDFVEQLQLKARYPGLQGIGFSRRLLEVEKEAFIQTMRVPQAGGQGLDFRIWPTEPRSEYHTIIYLEPLDRRNRAAIGYDMFTEPVRREAMERARDTGVAAASGKMTLVQEIDERKQAGFLIYVPVYRGGATPDTVDQRRAELLGFVYSPFLGGGPVCRHLRQRETHPNVDFEVYDGLQVAPDSRLRPGGPQFDPDGAPYRTTSTIPVAGRPWTIAVASSPEFDRASTRRSWMASASSGVLVSLLLAYIARAQAKAMSQHRLAEAALQRSSESMGALLSGSLDCIIGMDHRGRITEFNPAAERTFGYTRRDVLGRQMSDVIIPPELRQSHIDGLSRYLSTGKAHVLNRRIELTALRSNGEIFPVELAITRNSREDPPTFTGLVRDITDRKKAS